MIDQLYQAAEKIKRVQSSQDAQVALALAKEDELTREREEKEKEKKEREKEKKRFEEETKRFELEQKKLRDRHEAESKKRVVEVKKMVTITKGVQVELLPPPRIPTPPRPVRPLTPPPPPIASTSSSAIPSSSTGPQPSEPLDLEAIGEYQRLLSNVQAKLSQVEQDKVALDHRIAQMVQEKEAMWPEQRAVLMMKAEGEKRELEKKLEKALKRVEVLEKDRPAPVLRIGSEFIPLYLLERGASRLIALSSQVDLQNSLLLNLKLLKLLRDPIQDWFNSNHVSLKSKEISPKLLDEQLQQKKHWKNIKLVPTNYSKINKTKSIL